MNMVIKYVPHCAYILYLPRAHSWLLRRVTFGWRTRALIPQKAPEESSLVTDRYEGAIAIYVQGSREEHIHYSSKLLTLCTECGHQVPRCTYNECSLVSIHLSLLLPRVPLWTAQTCCAVCGIDTTKGTRGSSHRWIRGSYICAVWYLMTTLTTLWTLNSKLWTGYPRP